MARASTRKEISFQKDILANGRKKKEEMRFGRKLDHFEGKGKEMLQFKLFPVISSNLIMFKHLIITF